MLSSRKSLILAVAMACGLAAAPALAQYAAPASYENNTSQALMDLNQRLAAMEQQQQYAGAASYGGDMVGCEGGMCDEGCATWETGVGAYYLKPHWKTNPAYAITQTFGGGVTDTIQRDFNYDYDWAPIVWASFRGKCGFGLTGRAWWYDDAARLTLVNDGASAIESAGPLGQQNLSTTADDFLTFQSTLQIEVYDLIGTYLFRHGCASIELGGGARYARIEQGYAHAEIPDGGQDIDAVASLHTFKGVGPTMFVEGKYALTQNFSFFTTARYSVLFGQSEQNAQQIVNDNLTNTATQINNDVLGIGELDLGGEFVVPVGEADFFLQVAIFAQLWNGAGNSANSDVITVMVDPETSDKNADLGLWGARAAAGVRY